jgi:xanthine dehydrogenase YagR molybdenum-binding subunit
MSVIGSPLTRVDGKQKVAGTAKYTAEFEIQQLAYAVMVTSTIPSGQIAGMDTAAAEQTPGVLAVITPRNALRLPGAERRITVLQDTNV